MFSYIKNHLIITFLLVISLGCQIQEPLKTHGIVYLENRANKLTINKSNKNDVIRIIGQPQIKDEYDDNAWIYLERILSKGKYHKLGKPILKESNILVLNFNKYGILENKKIIKKEDINKLKFSEKETENELAQKSFIQTFLQSVKQKMYSNRK